MSINWVMKGSGPEGFIPLPKERPMWTSPPRAAIQIQSLNKFPGKEPYHLSSSAGRVHLTNQRIIYLPDPTTPVFQSFSAPLLRLHDSRVTTPFFGPNSWVALAQPVADGGIPSQHAAVEVKLTFKDGGTYDFHTKFIEIKERLRQAAEVAVESGQVGSGSHGAGVNLDSVHLEQLPAYQERSEAGRTLETSGNDRSREHTSEEVSAPTQPPQQHPHEPPPAYEEI